MALRMRTRPDAEAAGDGSMTTYLRRIPASAADVPAGLVVVHNSVRPTRRLGSRGFRAYLVEPHGRLEVCGCGWAPEVGVHYRVRFAEGRRS
jgi:hypothetical protein